MSPSSHSSRANRPINLHNAEEVAARRPLMIAHRGGVIAPDAPENTARAIELAAQQGYDMVELDVRRARDGVPVLFHGHGGDGRMLVDCGIHARIDQFTSSELREIRYRGTEQRILSLGEALGLCVDLGLGVMLDVKNEVSQPDYLHETTRLVASYGLENSVMTLMQNREILDMLPPQILWPIRQSKLAAALADVTNPLENQYWFDDPDSITDEELMQLQARGVLTIGCINSFRYPPHSFANLEGQDIARLLRLQVDGYQIDSCYGHFFEELSVSEKTLPANTGAEKSSTA